MPIRIKQPDPPRAPVHPPRWFPWNADPIEVRDYVWRRKRAQKKVYHAMKSGRLVRNNTCERCGFTWDGTLTSKIHAHHEDYNEPLRVAWLCDSCHGKRHGEINKEWQAKYGVR